MGEGETPQNGIAGGRRQQYEHAMLAIRSGFEENQQLATSGAAAVAARSSAVDSLILSLWNEGGTEMPFPATRVALIAVGGYGREELFPYSDVDLLFLLDPRLVEKQYKEPIRRLNQQLWDCGLRISPLTRTLTECERFNPENVEYTLTLLDARFLAGDRGVFDRFHGKSFPRLLSRERKRIIARIGEATRVRHRKYGDTLFHLEPNIKDCPGGLRDAHLCAWLARLEEDTSVATSDEIKVPGGGEDEFRKARDFLLQIRTFLHFRHQRDDNTLDWHAQDEAAVISLGVPNPGRLPVDAAYWMRLYFRHARSIERTAAQALEHVAPPPRASRLPSFAGLRWPGAQSSGSRERGFDFEQDCIRLNPAGSSAEDPAHDPEIMLSIFAAVARTGARLSRETDARLEGALPLLSAHLEDGPGLWLRLQSILTGSRAGIALRTMHAMGILELVIPEFHGIDALVIRDAYHRYTVDEHTFVLIDTLHALTTPQADKGLGLEPWAARFAQILRDLPHPGLLFLAALLHDTGKGHSTSAHAAESVRLAERVVKRLELDSYEAGLVLGLIRNHLEMSATLRRDVFEAETIRSFAARVPTPEALRMLAVFTYADISAVHPDALTPWKAENLYHLYAATAHYLDRNVDEERVGATGESEANDVIYRVAALLPGRRSELDQFLAGLPRRYLLTRTRDQIRTHFEMASRLEAASDPQSTPAREHSEPTRVLTSQAQILPDEAIQLDFRYAPEASELTLVSLDRPMLFANMAGALAAWGMDIVTADAFSNSERVVVDTFRFTDGFRTLELNESERERFVESIRKIMTGAAPVENMLAARRRGRRKAPKMNVETRVEFDNAASMHSTVLEVVAQDTSGLLRALTLTLAAHGCNIEVALVDTEGEMAIDVFYITHAGMKLEEKVQESLRCTLQEAIEANAS